MIYIGADHQGYKLKEALKKYLNAHGVKYEDMGNHALEPEDDFPDFAFAVGLKVASNPRKHRGILLCGSGIGMTMAANKVRSVRAGHVSNAIEARKGRSDDDVNVLVLSAWEMTPALAGKLVKIWFATPFSQEKKYRRRVRKVEAFEKKI